MGEHGLQNPPKRHRHGNHRVQSGKENISILVRMPMVLNRPPRGHLSFLELLIGDAGDFGFDIMLSGWSLEEQCLAHTSGAIWYAL